MQYCPLCDSKGELVHERRPLKMGRRTVVVEQEFYRCASCQEDWFTPEQMDAVQRLASEQVRQEESLLGPDAIKEIREELELSQGEFEKLLGFGAKTVGRWERGTVFQNRSSDLLMRLVREFPEVARYLASRHAVELPVDAAWRATSKTDLSEPGVSKAQTFRSRGAVPELNDLFRPNAAGFAPIVVELQAEEASVAS